MGRNNTVYLLVGQRGSGKSHYARQVIERQPEISALSRDEILVRLFGSVHTSPYTGEQYIAQEIMHRLLRRKLSTQTELKLILDTWTGYSEERKSLVKKLRQYGATRIVALYFVTSLKTVNIWFWKKPGIAKAEEMKARQGEGFAFFSKDAPAHDYEFFHENALRIDSNGFNEVIRIDPQKELITLS